MKNYRFTRTDNRLAQTGRHLHLVHGGGDSSTTAQGTSAAQVYALAARTAQRAGAAEVAEVRRRLHRHETAYRSLMLGGHRDRAFFEAESAEILAQWLTNHGHLPVSMLDSGPGAPSAC